MAQLLAFLFWWLCVCTVFDKVLCVCTVFDQSVCTVFDQSVCTVFDQSVCTVFDQMSVYGSVDARTIWLKELNVSLDAALPLVEAVHPYKNDAAAAYRRGHWRREEKERFNETYLGFRNM